MEALAERFIFLIAGVPIVVAQSMVALYGLFQTLVQRDIKGAARDFGAKFKMCSSAYAARDVTYTLIDVDEYTRLQRQCDAVASVAPDVATMSVPNWVVAVAFACLMGVLVVLRDELKLWRRNSAYLESRLDECKRRVARVELCVRALNDGNIMRIADHFARDTLVYVGGELVGRAAGSDVHLDTTIGASVVRARVELVEGVRTATLALLDGSYMAINGAHSLARVRVDFARVPSNDRAAALHCASARVAWPALPRAPALK